MKRVAFKGPLKGSLEGYYRGLGFRGLGFCGLGFLGLGSRDSGFIGL